MNKSKLSIIALIIIIFIIAIFLSIYYLVNGCYCKNSQNHITIDSVESIEYYIKNKDKRIYKNKDSIVLISNILNKSILANPNGKRFKNRFTSDNFVLKVCLKNGEFIRFDILRLDSLSYHVELQRNNNFYKQCFMRNTSLSEIIWQ
jgi:hypothetical protein